MTRVPAAGEDRKLAVFGAVDYATGQVIWQTHARKGEQAFMAFLDHLAAILPPDIPTVIVLDNVGLVDGLPRREISGHTAQRAPAPWATGMQQGEDSIEDFAERMASLSQGRGERQVEA